jgi:predicted GNAT family N-acyltransferase
VGYIDWPEITESIVSDLIETKHLYCFEDDHRVVAALKAEFEPDQRIWENEITKFVYIGRAATAKEVRGMGYFKKQMLPGVMKYGEENEAYGIRLDCLADNDGLNKFYRNLGFELIGQRTFYSDRLSKELEVSKYQMLTS